MQYSIVPESLLSQLKVHEDHMLTTADIRTLTFNRQVFEKFIRQRAFAIQTELGMWTRKGKEAEAYGAVEELDYLARLLSQVEIRQAEIESKHAEDVLKSAKNE